MTQREIADELFNAAKEVKKCYLKERFALYHTTSEKRTSDSQYVQILNNLTILYRSLDFETSSSIKIDELMDNVQHAVISCDRNLFTVSFLSVLDTLLLNTVKFRGKICLIRRNDRIPGLASHIITNLGQIIKSIENGYLPVIDTFYTDNIFTQLSRSSSLNAWELYFKQPFMITLQDIAPDREVTIWDGIPSFMPNYSMDCLMNPELMSFWRDIARKYLPLSSSLNDSLNFCLNRLPFGNGTKILGVLCRGTDYINIRPYNHPVQPTPDAVLAKTHEYMEKYQCDYCYLATEDQEILHIFKQDLKNRLLATQEIYYSSDLNDPISQANNDLSINIHRKNIEYLTALLLLSKCQYFIGGRTSGTIVSLLLSDGFEKSYLWNLGRYGIDDSLTLRSYLY